MRKRGENEENEDIEENEENHELELENPEEDGVLYQNDQTNQTIDSKRSTEAKKIPSFVAGPEKPRFNHGVMNVLYLKPF